jgi:hypothetical protein
MFRLYFVLLLAAAASACGSSTTAPTTTTPPPTIQETFNGTLTKSGGATHPFAVSRSGAVNVVLTSIAPDSTLVVGLSLGTWNGTACQAVLVKDNATQGSTLLGSASSTGNLCVRIYDVGHLVGSITYQIDVVHP